MYMRHLISSPHTATPLTAAVSHLIVLSSSLGPSPLHFISHSYAHCLSSQTPLLQHTSTSHPSPLSDCPPPPVLSAPPSVHTTHPSVLRF